MTPSPHGAFVAWELSLAGCDRYSNRVPIAELSSPRQRQAGILMSVLHSGQNRFATMTSDYAILACLVLASAAASAESPTPIAKLTPLQRMARVRLKAAHEDVVRIQRGRHELPKTAGWNDYRAILHAHAEDSAHTGGTRPEMLAEAKRAGINAILLTDHYRPPRDFMTDSWRGLREGVLFVPGSEERGFLIYPTRFDRRPDERPDAVVSSRRCASRWRPDLPVAHRGAARPSDGGSRRHGDLQSPRRRQDGRGRAAGRFSSSPPAGARRSFEEALRLYPDELLRRQDDIRPTTWRSGTPRPGRDGSPGWPPTIAITTWSCS